MSKLVRCDNCREELREHQAASWMRVESFGGHRSVSTNPGPWHFCSQDCLARNYYRESPVTHQNIKRLADCGNDRGCLHDPTCDRHTPEPIEMVEQLHRAVHGDSWARTESPSAVWRQLLKEVSEARACVAALEAEREKMRHFMRVRTLDGEYTELDVFEEWALLDAGQTDQGDET